MQNQIYYMYSEIRFAINTMEQIAILHCVEQKITTV